MRVAVLPRRNSHVVACDWTDFKMKVGLRPLRQGVDSALDFEGGVNRSQGLREQLSPGFARSAFVIIIATIIYWSFTGPNSAASPHLLVPRALALRHVLIGLPARSQ